MKRVCTYQWLVLLVVTVGLLVFWSRQITGAPIEKDAAETLRMAIDLEKYGIVSDGEQPPFKPSMTREPLPVFVTALAARMVDGMLGPADSLEYFSGQRAQLLKCQNVLWLLLLSAAVFVLAMTLMPSFGCALLCVLSVNLLLLRADIGVYMTDSLYTEAPAAALLTVTSLFLSIGIGRDRVLLVACAGVCFGLLALVKASFLYVAVGIALVIPLVSPLYGVRMAAAVRPAAVLCLTLLVTVVPWMARNYAELGTFGISGRGGLVLYTRAVKDQMTPTEYFGSFYYWAPYPFGGVLGRILGFSRADLERGGRLQHLNRDSSSSFAKQDQEAEEAGRPQDAIAYYRRSRAESVLLSQQFAAAGNPLPDEAADAELKHRATQMFKEHPWRHVALIVPFLWRGAFFVFPPLAAALFYSLRRGRYELGLATLPSLGMLAFYALFSHFIPRYSIPAYPVALCAIVLLVSLLYQRVHGTARLTPGTA